VIAAFLALRHGATALLQSAALELNFGLPIRRRSGACLPRRAAIRYLAAALGTRYSRASARILVGGEPGIRYLKSPI